MRDTVGGAKHTVCKKWDWVLRTIYTLFHALWIPFCQRQIWMASDAFFSRFNEIRTSCIFKRHLENDHLTRDEKQPTIQRSNWNSQTCVVKRQNSKCRKINFALTPPLFLTLKFGCKKRVNCVHTGMTRKNSHTAQFWLRRAFCFFRCVCAKKPCLSVIPHTDAILFALFLHLVH